MAVILHQRWRLSVGVLLILPALIFALSSRALTLAAVSIVQLSNDPYTNSTSQHKTEVEPDSFSFGSTIVAATQVGRFTDGGSSNIGWMTSTNNGRSWTPGFLPGTTTFATPPGPYDRVSDPSVAYDAKHSTWLISSLALKGTIGAAVIINGSTNGGTVWNTAVNIHVVTGTENLDKDWIVCDDTSTSPFYGHCYVEWDNFGNGNLVQMSTSTDGGITWSAPQTTANSASVIGGQPLVQPNGTVIVPIDDANETSVLAFTSTNGGTSWSNTVTVASITSHTDPGGIRSGPLPSAEIDGSGKVYVVWEDCRFESGCSANDIVMSTSSDGVTWSAVQRIPSDSVGSGVDHFIPGIAVDKSTSGSSAHLVVAFYYYPNVNCFSSTCRLNIGYSSSTDSGAHWTSTTNITGPMTLSWLANTTQGKMVGDYISASFNSTGMAFPVFAVAAAPTPATKSCGRSGVTCHETLDTVSSGLAVLSGNNTSNNDQVLFTAQPTTSTQQTAR